MAEVYFFPTIIWKLKGVIRFCKLKTPCFNALGVKWKLKFIFSESVRGNICQIFLKRHGGGFDGLQIKVSTKFLGVINFEQSVILTDSTTNKWLIWEETEENMLSQSGLPRMEKFFNRKYFECAMAPTNDWQGNGLVSGEKFEVQTYESPICITSLCNDFGKLFNSHVMSDVTLACGDRKIYAHRNILAARSEVFSAMFQNDMKESRVETIEIRDVEPSVLEQLLRYMYSGKVPDLTLETAYELYAAADMYRVEALKMKCCVFMVENCMPHAPEAGMMADSEDSSYLKITVLRHFANIKALLSTEEWKKLSETEPKLAHRAFNFFARENPF